VFIAKRATDRKEHGSDNYQQPDGEEGPNPDQQAFSGGKRHGDHHPGGGDAGLTPCLAFT
jgi:hypothetical protein